MLRKLSKLDLESVALYYASQTPAPRSAPAIGDAAAGEPRTAVCGGCHGSHGVSTDSATPSLASEDPQYLTQAIKAYRTTRKHDLMQRLVSTLSDAGHQQYRRVLHDAEVEARGKRPDPAQGHHRQMQSLPCRREGQSGAGDPDHRRAGQGLSDAGVAGLSRRQARKFHDAQHEPALQRFHHREHRVVLREPAGEVGTNRVATGAMVIRVGSVGMTKTQIERMSMKRSVRFIFS